MDPETLARAVEAVIFASAEPLPLAKLEEVFAPGGVDGEALRDALAAVEAACAGRGVELREVGGGYQFRTRPEAAPWVARLEVARPVRFSRAALESLAVVAYRQPVTRAEVEEVRGVDCGGVLKLLLDRGLVRVVGKKDVPGRPLLYGSTRKFLEAFGLASLAELPNLRDIQEILAEREEGAEEEAEEEGGKAVPPEVAGGPVDPDGPEGEG